MFRDAHTIKGNAGVIQSGEIEWFAHILESVLERLYSGALPQDAAPEDLRDHLLWQLNLTPMPERDRAIATAIIDAIDMLTHGI